MTRRLTLGFGETGQRYWMNIVIYETAEQLHKAAHKHRPDEGGLDAWSNCGGCFQPHPSSQHYLGIMRLCNEHLTPEVVIHESVHAAVAYTWKHLDLQVIHLNPFSPSSMANREEILAYAVHGISAPLLAELGLTTQEV